MLLLEAKKAAVEWRTGVPDAETAFFFDGRLCSEPSPPSDGDPNSSATTLLEGGLHCLGVEEAVWGHRAGVVAALAPVGS